MKYIYHHLGLGDHIICNGLVRSIINPSEEYSIFVKSHNLATVKFMYRDLKNLSYIEGDDEFVTNFLRKNEIKKENMIIAGFYNHPKAKDFAESFYLQNSIPEINRWTKFHVDRDLEGEKKIFEYYGVSENEYVFVHDDSTRGYEIDENLIVNKDLKIIRPVLGLTDNVFHYCYLMQKSCESHFIDSSFRLIFDCMLLRDENIYYHIKMKNNNRRNTIEYYDATTCGLNFKIIK